MTATSAEQRELAERVSPTGTQTFLNLVSGYGWFCHDCDAEQKSFRTVELAGESAADHDCSDDAREVSP